MEIFYIKYLSLGFFLSVEEFENEILITLEKDLLALLWSLVIISIQ